MQLHQLQPKTKRKKTKRVGRGGTRGKTSGRGHKGQKARAGNSMRPEMRDIIKRLPKKRGFGKNRARSGIRGVKPLSVNIGALESHFAAGEKVTPRVLALKGLIRKRKGSHTAVKILGHGTLTKKLSVEGCLTSKSALEGITKAGGNVLSAPLRAKAK